jgi:inorganic pyrophosphatase
VIPSRVVGAVRLSQQDSGGRRVRNDRIIAVPLGDERYDDVGDFTKRMRRELENFFVLVSSMTHKQVIIDSWDGPKKAARLVESAAQAYVRGRAPK